MAVVSAYDVMKGVTGYTSKLGGLSSEPCIMLKE